MLKYTPPPWTAKRTPTERSWFVWGPDGLAIAVLPGADAEGNARIMAASLGLLQVAREAAQTIDSLNRYDAVVRELRRAGLAEPLTGLLRRLNAAVESAGVSE